MTTTHAAPALMSARAHRRVASAAVRRRVLRALLVAGAWFWAIWAALVVGAPLAVDRWGGELEGLTYDAAAGPARWVCFAVGLITTAVFLTVHVAAGGTRRSYRDGVLQAAVLAAAVFVVLSVLLSVAEERLYAAIDRPYQGNAGPLDLDGPVGLIVTGAGEGLVLVTYVLVGVAIQAGYRTVGAWRGTLLVLPLLVPAAIADVATRTGLAGLPLRDGYDDVVLGTVGTLGGGLVAAALAAVVAHRLLRTVPLRP